MKAIVKSATGKKVGEMKLPAQFEEEVRPDLIKRAVLAIKSHKRQPYGSDPEAGKKYSSKLSRRRRDYRGAYGFGISRVPRKILSRRGTRMNWEGATAPNTRGGRQAHPPKVEKDYSEKINKKERRKAIRSAMAASVIKDIVVQRGHVVDEYPLVIEDKVQDIGKTNEVVAFLVSLGLEKELIRAAKRTEKTGRARRRGRTHSSRKGPLVVVSKKCPFMKAAANVPGVDVVDVMSLNAELLAPGTDIGRLTLYTKSAVEMLEKQLLFTDNPLINEVVQVDKKESTSSKTSSKKSSKKKSSKKKPSKKKSSSKKASKSSKKKTYKKSSTKKSTKKASKK